MSLSKCDEDRLPPNGLPFSLRLVTFAILLSFLSSSHMLLAGHKVSACAQSTRDPMAQGILWTVPILPLRYRISYWLSLTCGLDSALLYICNRLIVVSNQ
jgi:hypothetical protein